MNAAPSPTVSRKEQLVMELLRVRAERVQIMEQQDALALRWSELMKQTTVLMQEMASADR